MDARERALERQAALGDAEAADQLKALQGRRTAPPPTHEYGLMIAGHGIRPRTLEAAAGLVAELRGCPQEEARAACRASVVPVLEGRTSREEVEAAAARFQALGVVARVTAKRLRPD